MPRNIIQTPLPCCCCVAVLKFQKVRQCCTFRLLDSSLLLCNTAVCRVPHAASSLRSCVAELTSSKHCQIYLARRCRSHLSCVETHNWVVTVEDLTAQWCCEYSLLEPELDPQLTPLSIDGVVWLLLWLLWWLLRERRPCDRAIASICLLVCWCIMRM